MKTPNQTIRHFDRLHRRTIQFVRWNLPVLLMTGLSLLFLKCEGTSSDPKTLLIPLLVSADANTTSQLGNNPTGTGGQTIPIAVGEPTSSAPILNDVSFITNNANPADDPYSTKGLLQFQKSSVSFQNPVPANTELNFYFGKKNMELQPDGTVTNALQTLNRTAGNFSGHTFLVDSDKKYKVFVVAKNEFGISTKQLKIGHARKCAEAIKTPGTFGNCVDHCFETNQLGDKIEITVKYNLPIDGTSLSLDLTALSPRSLPETIAPRVDLSIGTPKAGEHTIKTNFGIHEKEFLCAEISSFLTVNQPYRFSILKGYVVIPNE
ncbi:hypothetical protein EHQ68_11430 [Leptospira congkakensis]|uniref:Uncharacterized protein n=1 Tax=Leptospira congkakensis TaxID=2484932 RepID=A0A4Z1AB88_9LEPT|nr:hypothetical protein [Leptospira congkakensis]TGL87161.1 hypothetical protein EHQ68_11430 [Leptospira congkakensis]TGL96729.1 hypothetical protein EHQ69_00375 [Leptospira congkakensis]TGL97578.1 hypothetical protein EHQ70_06030 [Leptospira congkakensis]